MPGVYNIQVPVQPAAPISVLPADLAVSSKASERSVSLDLTSPGSIQIQLKASRAESVLQQQKGSRVGGKDLFSLVGHHSAW